MYGMKQQYYHTYTNLKLIFLMTRSIKLPVIILLIFFLFSCNKSEKSEGFVTTVGTGTDKIKVAVVQGTPYEMGSQLGSLLKNEIDSCLFKILNKYHGSFDAQSMIELSRAVASSGGNLLNVVYDATTLEMWVAYANGSEDASKQSYIHLKMNDLK